MGKKKVLVSYGEKSIRRQYWWGATDEICSQGVDIDAVAGWLGSYGGEDSTSDISRQISTSHPPEVRC